MKHGSGLRRRATAAVSAALLAAVVLTSLAAGPATGAERNSDRVVRRVHPTPVADFRLLDHRGREFRLSALRGKAVLLFFGFRSCPDVCPAALHQLRLVSKRGGFGDAVQVIFITVDPQRDTAAALSSYIEAFSPRFLALTGSEKALRAVREQFGVRAFAGTPSPQTGYYAVDHGSQIFLIDQQGRLAATFFDSPTAAMVREVRNVLAVSPASSGTVSQAQEAGNLVSHQ